MMKPLVAWPGQTPFDDLPDDEFEDDVPESDLVTPQAENSDGVDTRAASPVG
jgi:hypothetical protein